MGESGQDGYVWRNLFARATLKGERGFYVDSGSWHPYKASNTWFFDRCLGWNGVCVEPVASHWRMLEEHRSCTLAKACLSAERTSMSIAVKGPHSTLSKGDGRAKRQDIACVPISTIAKQANRSTIDFWSLDVEGHELEVLSHDWEAHGLTVNALMVEDHHQVLAVLDRLALTSHSFVKVAQMPLDTLYVSRHSASFLPAQPWNSEGEQQSWELSRVKFRKGQPGGQGTQTARLWHRHNETGERATFLSKVGSPDAVDKSWPAAAKQAGHNRGVRGLSFLAALKATPQVLQWYELAAPISISRVTVAKPEPPPLLRGSFAASPAFSELTLAQKRARSSLYWDSGQSSELNAYNPSIARVPVELRNALHGASYAITQRVTNHHTCHHNTGIPGLVVNLFAFGLLDESLQRMVGHEALVALPIERKVGKRWLNGFDDCRLQSTSMTAAKPNYFMLVCGKSAWQVELRSTERADEQFDCKKMPLSCPTSRHQHNQSRVEPRHIMKHGLEVVLHGHQSVGIGMAKNLNILDVSGRLFVEEWVLNVAPNSMNTSKQRISGSGRVQGRRLHTVAPLDQGERLQTYEAPSVVKPLLRLWAGGDWSNARGGGCCVTLTTGTDSVRVGIAHSKNRKKSGEYVHFFYAMEASPPMKIVAVSSPFCFPAASNSSSCERGQFAMSIVDAEPTATAPTDAVVIPYGVNDCSSKAATVTKAEILRLLSLV